MSLEQPRELATGGGLAGAVQTEHHQAGGVATQLKAGMLRAQQFDQFVVDDSNDLLAGLDALDDLLADGLLFDPLDEIAGDLEMNVGVQQSHPNLAQRI